MAWLSSLPLNDPRVAFWLPIAAFFAIVGLLFMIGRMLVRGSGSTETELTAPGWRIFGPLTSALAGVLPVSGEQMDAIRNEVRQAGYYRPLAAEQFLAFRNSLLVGWVLLIATAVVVAYDPQQDPTFILLAIGAAGLAVLYAGPRLYLQSLARNRVNRIQRQLPDGLDMITMCMTGGLSLYRALDRVGDELRSTHRDLALELDIIRRQAEAHSLEHSLEQFAKRIDAPDVQTLSALVAQTERLGSNVAVALKEFADGIRRSFRQRAEERGNKTSVQMMLPVAFCLAPPVYILLLAPAAIELRDFVVQENRSGGVLQPGATDIDELTRQAELQSGSSTAPQARRTRPNAPTNNRAANNRSAAAPSATAPRAGRPSGSTTPATPGS